MKTKIMEFCTKKEMGNWREAIDENLCLGDSIVFLEKGEYNHLLRWST